MKQSALFALTTLLVVSVAHCCEKQLLTGVWRLFNNNHSINTGAIVPGGVYSDLMINDIIQDIYYRFNDAESRWVANEVWTYSRIFNACESHFEANHVNLVFDGLDTFSTIILNGVEIGKSENMFVRYSFDIKKVLKKEENNLTVVFESPIKKAAELAKEQDKKYPVPPSCVPSSYRGECHINHIRKMQASFAWDWGPAFPSVGIWKPVYIVSYQSAIIQDIIVELKEKNYDWDVTLKIYLSSNAKVPLKGTIIAKLTTDLNTVSIINNIQGNTNENGEYIHVTSVSVPKTIVNHWWPNGFGEQHLYDLKVTYAPSDTNEQVSKKIRIGFRTVELVQTPARVGANFYFKINDVPIFAKGSNWIPVNILPEIGTNESKVRFLLESTKEANMNMLRVWGGGVYESDIFYEIADELGILIWQDFMFACSMYPTNKEFLKTVTTEVQQQVRRLQHHPCIAIWAGSNENEAALSGNWYGTSGDFDLYKKDFVTLYIKTVRDNSSVIDNTRPYVASSPTNGIESEKEGYVANNPYDLSYGDLHYYNYYANGWDPDTYLNARFISEYGVQGMPFYETLESATNITDDLKIDSAFLSSRQHLSGGYSYMDSEIETHMTLPNKTKENYLKTYIYYSQINQAMTIKVQSEFYRQWRNRDDALGNGLTMGALYWQLNDVWQAPTWASIDFNQNWKMLHYYAKNFFAPIIVTGFVSSAKDLTVFVVSDVLAMITNANLTTYLYKWDSLTPVNVKSKELTIIPATSTIITQLWLEKYLEKNGCGSISEALNKCFIYFTLTNAEGKPLAPDNFIFFTPLKSAVGLTTPKLTVSVVEGSKSNTFNVTVTTDKIAPFVWLETKGIKGRFSDNGFLLVYESRTIQYESSKPTTVNELQSSMTVTSLLSDEHL